MKLGSIVLLLAGFHLVLVTVAWGHADVLTPTAHSHAWSRVLNILLFPVSMLLQQSRIPFLILIVSNSLLWGCVGASIFLAARAGSRAISRA
jgi:hypothetical protein